MVDGSTEGAGRDDAHNGERPECDVVVVGAGLAGLFAAVEAATLGARTVLVEARGAPGGRARTDVREVRPGTAVRLNLGPHALHRTGATRRELDRLGVSVAGRRPPSRVVRFCTGEDVHRLPAPGLGRTARLVLALLGRHGAPDDVPLDVWMHRTGLDGGARSGAEALVRLATYTDAPDRISAGAALGAVRSALVGGVEYLHDGWGAMVEALLERALARGVELRCAAATDVTRDRHGWRVALAGEPHGLDARAVVVAAGRPDAAARLLHVVDDRWAADAVDASVLDVVAARPPRHRSLFGTDQPLYLATHSPPARLVDCSDGDPGPAPAPALVTALLYHRPGGGTAAHDEVRRSLRRYVERSGLHRDDVLHERYLHRVTVAGSFPEAAAGGLAGRPAVEVADRPGAMIAGDWVGPEGLLADASTASGIAAGRAAARAARSSAPSGSCAPTAAGPMR